MDGEIKSIALAQLPNRQTLILLHGYLLSRRLSFAASEDGILFVRKVVSPEFGCPTLRYCRPSGIDRRSSFLLLSANKTVRQKSNGTNFRQAASQVPLRKVSWQGSMKRDVGR